MTDEEWQEFIRELERKHRTSGCDDRDCWCHE